MRFCSFVRKDTSYILSGAYANTRILIGKECIKREETYILSKAALITLFVLRKSDKEFLEALSRLNVIAV